MKKCFIILWVLIAVIPATKGFGQVQWANVDSNFGLDDQNAHVYMTTDSLDGQPFKAYYFIASARNKSLRFETDTSLDRRLTPLQFYERNQHPLLVINSTFFSFATNRSLNLVIRNGRLKAFNQDVIPRKGKDTLTYTHVFTSSFGISKKGKPDIAWTFTDSNLRHAYAVQKVVEPLTDSSNDFSLAAANKIAGRQNLRFKKWKMKNAVGGGPVLLQDGIVRISSAAEMKFSGKAMQDKHPRTLVGYRPDGAVIFMAIEGRNKGVAEGATLTQCAALMQALGCVEAINLDGGGSSCMLVNGRETIKTSDKEGERPVPAIFMVRNRRVR